MSANSASFGHADGPPWTRSAAAFARRFAGAALDTLYPPTCLACRAATDAHGALCAGCWRAMRFIERPFCERLGTPFRLNPHKSASVSLSLKLHALNVHRSPLAFARSLKICSDAVATDVKSV